MKLNRIEERKVGNFIHRYKAHAKADHIDNSRLPAGSPMYYYCQACGLFITALPEAHTFPRPNTATVAMICKRKRCSMKRYGGPRREKRSTH